MYIQDPINIKIQFALEANMKYQSVEPPLLLCSLTTNRREQGQTFGYPQHANDTDNNKEVVFALLESFQDF